MINRKLAALERGEDALVFGSGMAAITTLLMAHLRPGDHALFQADLYGGTHQLVTSELPRLGVAVSFCRTPEEFAVASRQMRGFGGMLSFELREAGRVDVLLGRLRLVLPALSLGGVESLVCVPSRTSHRKLSPAERERVGINEGLVRVSVGVEDIEDLVADFEQALDG